MRQGACWAREVLRLQYLDRLPQILEMKDQIQEQTQCHPAWPEQNDSKTELEDDIARKCLTLPTLPTERNIGLPRRQWVDGLWDDRLHVCHRPIQAEGL
jgi:hypothetical protein